MALIVDASALYAQADADEPGHATVAHILTTEREALVTTELAVAEADFLILRRLGVSLARISQMERGEDVQLSTCLVSHHRAHPDCRR